MRVVSNGYEGFRGRSLAMDLGKGTMKPFALALAALVGDRAGNLRGLARQERSCEAKGEALFVSIVS